MSNTSLLLGSLDLQAPIQYEDGQFRIWNKNQIWLGEIGEGKFVAQVGDEIHDIVGAVINKEIVTARHPTTLIPTLTPEDTSRETDPMSENEIYFGVGPGTQSDTYRVFVDKSVNPHILTPDSRLDIGGINTTYCKIFRGTYTGHDGIVISAVLNQNGEIVSENVPLELTAINNITNHSRKIVASAHTTFDLKDGEPCTVVFYNNQNVVVSKRQCLIENTAFIRALDASRAYVTSIALETPFMSTANATLIQYPMNIPLTALNLIGVVNYSDGKSKRMPVDGTRFSVQGLQGFAPTIPQQTAKITLKYLFSNLEYGLGEHVGNEIFTTANYEIRATGVNATYAVQLYCYPVWVDSTVGYSLRWFMYDLNRGIHYDVTQEVVIDTAFSTFQPRAYGTLQTLSVSVNLKAVNGSYKNFHHVQVVDIQLNRRGSERPGIDQTANWQVASVAGTTPRFGNKAYAVFYRQATNDWRLKLKAEHLTQSEWLKAFWEPTNPLFDPNAEIKPPTPTHFRLIAGANSAEYPIESWSEELALTSTITNNSTVFLEFFTRTVENDLHTSIAGVPLFQVDDLGQFI